MDATCRLCGEAADGVSCSVFQWLIFICWACFHACQRYPELYDPPPLRRPTVRQEIF